MGWTFDGTKLVVTGTGETLAAGYTADLAGTLTLDNARAINADPTTYSLTTQVAPADSKQLKLTISASADKAGATMDITGTDLDGDAISETIDISTANSTPVDTVLKYKTVDTNGIVVNGITDGTTVTITQGRWGAISEYVTSGIYVIHKALEVGDALINSGATRNCSGMGSRLLKGALAGPCSG